MDLDAPIYDVAMTTGMAIAAKSKLESISTTESTFTTCECKSGIGTNIPDTQVQISDRTSGRAKALVRQD